LGNKVIVAGGMGLVCAALAWISTVSQTTSCGIIAAQMVVFGIGMGMTQSPAARTRRRRPVHRRPSLPC